MTEEQIAKRKSEIDEFAIPIGTGMKPVARNLESRFDAESEKELRRRLDDLDAVRVRGNVESRSVHLGAHPQR